MHRISRRHIQVTMVCLTLGGLFSIGGLVLSLREDLSQAVTALEVLQEKSDVHQVGLSQVETRLGGVDQELEQVREQEAEAREQLLAQLEERKQLEGRAIRAELETLEERVKALRAAAEEHAEMLAAAEKSEDVETRYRELMSPTVRINGRNEVGSGSLLFSRLRGDCICTYALTAYHIVQDDVAESLPVEVDFYEDGQFLRTQKGRVVYVDAKLDLALVEVRGEYLYPHLARLPTREELAKLTLFLQVYAIGCPLGYPPLPTSGELTSLAKELDGIQFWMINAPTIFGNSGGGIYLARENMLIGVLSRISAYKNMIDVAVPHMGLVMPLDQVYDWLDRGDFSFVYRDRLSELRTLPASTSSKD